MMAAFVFVGFASVDDSNLVFALGEGYQQKAG
jgi:hypothetical protein